MEILPIEEPSFFSKFNKIKEVRFGIFFASLIFRKVDQLRILLAEDDKNFGFVLKKELEEDQYMVDLVPDGVEAVLGFIAKIYDIVLLDLRMPRLSGTDVLRIIKKINPDVPAITFSGNAGRAEMEESMKFGAIKCFTKPLEIAQLKNDIKNFISEGEAHGRLPSRAGNFRSAIKGNI